MNKLPIKIAITFSVFFVLIFIGCIFFSLNLYTEANLQLKNIEAQYANEEVITTNESWVNTTPLAYTDGLSSDKFDNYNAIYKFNSTYFVSYSEYWDETKLHDLAIELYNNVHGEEINYVARVEVVNGEMDSYAGYHTSEYENFSLPISMYGAMPLNMTMDVTSRFSVIRLTGADTNQTVETMARTMSHEYGHHYTQFYFGFNGTDGDLNTKYYDIRNESQYDIYSESPSWDYYLENHMWNIQEIAAEDYVYLMGSPTAHRTIDYMDTQELVDVYSTNEAEYEKLELSMRRNAYNSMPHENPVMRTPNAVPGLAEYYYSFIGVNPPVYSDKVYTDLNIQVNQDGAYGYEVIWEQYYTDPSVMYTLMLYDYYDRIIKVVRTTNGGERGSASIGTRIAVNNMMEYTVDDGIPSLGFARFRVVTVLPDNTAFYSAPYDVQFS